MIQTVTIKAISRSEKVSPKTQKPYTSLGFKCAEHGDRWINGFGNKNNKDWKEGDEIKVDIKEVESNGKKYLNFETVDVNADLLVRVTELERTVAQMREAMKPIYLEWKKVQPRETSKVAGTDIDYPEMAGEIGF